MTINDHAAECCLNQPTGHYAQIRLSDQLLNSNLTESLFRPAHLVALDLAALNIQRGRDHALPSYNEWRRHCSLPVATTFDDLKTDIHSQSLREKLQQLYGHPSNAPFIKLQNNLRKN